VANVKITELTALTNPASSDVLPIVDVGTDETKKVTIADLLENAGSGNASAAAFAFEGDADTGMYRTGANALGFTTGGTGRLFINSSGNAGIGTASPAVACDVVGQVRASTGILFGSDTAAANALDDYEEGSWTPTISSESGSWGSITYGLRQGWYTKIGALVHLSCALATNDVASGTESGDLVITGVPFPLNFGSTSIQGALGSISWSRTSQATWPYGVSHTGGASQQLRFLINSGTSQVAYAPTTDIATGSNPFHNQISFSYTYLTNN
jgi:hypothetical protein